MESGGKEGGREGGKVLEAGPESPDRPYCLGEALLSLPLLAFSSQHLRLQFILSDHQAMHTDTGQPAVSINLTHVSSMSLSLSFFLSFFLLLSLSSPRFLY